MRLSTTPATAQSVYSTAYTFTTFAGYAGVGSADGVGTEAQFNNPVGVAVDTNGNVFVVDGANDTIRKITPAGVVNTIAGVAGNTGSNDGTNAAARFNGPYGVAVDGAGVLYVTDGSIRKLTPVGADWVVSTIIGLDGTDYPIGVAVDSGGSLYMAVGTTVRKGMRVGTNWVVTTIAGLEGISGHADGMGTNASFSFPCGIAVDSGINVYVTDADNDTVRKITPVGTNWVVSTIAGLAGVSGSADGAGSNARFTFPVGVAVDSGGNVYVADNENSTIRKIQPVGTNWVVSTLAGLAGVEGTTDGTGSSALFSFPEAVALDSEGNVYVADTANNLIRRITQAGVVSTVAGAAESPGSANGTGSSAHFFRPLGLAVDDVDNVYVADTFNSTVRRITAAGVVTTVAGFAGNNGSADGAGNNALFYYPYGIAANPSGNLYVADYTNSTIREISPAGVVGTVAGRAGSFGSQDGMGATARFYHPSGAALSSAGDIYVTDNGNLTVRRIVPAGTNWVVSTIAGLAGVSGSADGIGNTARFGSIYGGLGGLAIDDATNIYVTDIGNSTIRKIAPLGTNWMVSTIAGSPGLWGSDDGMGSNARFFSPWGIAVDHQGTVYVADYDFDTIRRIVPTGTNWEVSTIAGLAGITGSAEGAGSAARFAGPSGVAVDHAGNIYVADSFNNTIRKGVFTQYTATNAVPYTRPSMSAQLVVTLLPLEANGQWRFPWDLSWRNSGQVVSNLVADNNYPIEFRNPPGYLAYPPTATVALSGGATTQVTNQYYPTLNLTGTTNTGALTVNIGPSVPIGAGWRFLGDTNWQAPGSTVSNLLPDSYAIEFAQITHYSKPPSQAVQVSAGSTTVIWAGYLLAQSPPAGVNLPAAVTNSINDLTNYPFGFNGQLQSDVGYGSGVAVLPNVVLTAAHLVFNDQTLSYVNQVWWRFQREAGVFEPFPVAARGWYVLSGYAAQRTNDVLGGLGPDQSSPQSRNLDVAALYFPEPVAGPGGGYGGYLPSDAVPNSWLTSTSEKMLVGYPVDGSLFGDTNIVPGVMYQVGPQPYPLSLATDPVAEQQVYTAPWFLSYPGNSGGPLYVQYNGYYYPAGVYLGTLYNGIVPYASLVRGIDSNVVNLITWAQTLGDAGTNGAGGVITISSGSGLPGKAYLQIYLGPPAAIAAGGGWRVPRSSSPSYYPSYYSTNYLVTFSSGGTETVEFNQILGWDLASSTDVTVALGQLSTVTATYTLSPALSVSPAGGLSFSGYAGGPFSPTNVTCTLTNSGAASLNWTAATAANWLTLSATSGVLAAGTGTNVTVCVNANANSLAPSNYTATVGFTNLSNGLGNTAYLVSLLVTIHPPVQFTGVSLLTNSAVAMTLQGVTGRVYSIVASTNLLNPLTNWAEVLRLTNTAGQTVFTNQSPTNAPRYYRAKEL